MTQTTPLRLSVVYSLFSADLPAIMIKLCTQYGMPTNVKTF